MSQHKTILGIRTNASYSIDYESKKLTPVIELIILNSEPKYDVNKKGEVVKSHQLSEYRFFTNIDGVNDMIGKLKVIALQLQNNSQLSESINEIIKGIDL